MKYTAYLLDTRTGITHEHQSAMYGGTVENLQFYWNEGNNACDCNRRDYIGEEGDFGCSNGLIQCTKIVLENGEEVDIEEQELSPWVLPSTNLQAP